jgi:hypothetical protein
LAAAVKSCARAPASAIDDDAISDAVERAMDAAGMETAHLVGNSLGGYLAPRLAARGRRDVKRDVDTPDLLAELQRQREILTGTRYEEVGNTPFSSEELAEIAEGLRQIKEYVNTAYALSEVQMLHLEAKIEDIAAAAGRMGRKDWALWVSAALLGAFVQGILPPEVVQHIIRMTVDGLGYLLGGWGTPPLLPPMT